MSLGLCAGQNNKHLTIASAVRSTQDDYSIAIVRADFKNAPRGSINPEIIQ